MVNVRKVALTLAYLGFGVNWWFWEWSENRLNRCDMFYISTYEGIMSESVSKESSINIKKNAIRHPVDKNGLHLLTSVVN